MANSGQTMFRFAGALLLAAGATLIDHPTPRSTLASSRVKTAPVVVAAANIPEGVAIDRSALVVAQWPLGTQPPGAYASIDSVTHRVSRVAIHKGEAIVPGRLAPEGTGAGLEVKIAPGKRAYSIRVNDVGTLAGLTGPNARVDVMVILDDPKRPGNLDAWVVAQDLRVLAIGGVNRRAPDGTRTREGVVTLEVAPEDTEFLATAAAQGELQIMLRGYGDAGWPSATMRKIESARELR